MTLLCIKRAVCLIKKKSCVYLTTHWLFQCNPVRPLHLLSHVQTHLPILNKPLHACLTLCVMSSHGLTKHFIVSSDLFPSSSPAQLAAIFTLTRRREEGADDVKRVLCAFVCVLCVPCLLKEKSDWLSRRKGIILNKSSMLNCLL